METGPTYVSELLSIYALYLGAAMVPGPNLFVISGSSLGASRAHGISTALGVSTGTVVFSVSSLAGLSAVVVAIPSIATATRVLGAVYLLYLGTQALSRAIRGTSAEMQTGHAARTLGRAYLRGLLTHLGNPKAVVFYLSLMTVVVTPRTPTTVQVAAVIGIVALSIGWYGSVALALSRTSVRARYRRTARWVDGLLGAALVGAGIRLAFSRDG